MELGLAEDGPWLGWRGFGEWITGMCDRCEMSLHNDIPRPYRITASFVYSRENNQAYNFCENCQLPQTIRESETYFPALFLIFFIVPTQYVSPQL